MTDDVHDLSSIRTRCGDFLRTGHDSDGLSNYAVILLQMCCPFHQVLPKGKLRQEGAFSYLRFIEVPKVKLETERK